MGNDPDIAERPNNAWCRCYGNDIKSFIKGVLINSTWRSSRSIGSVYFVLEY
ncbi:hypothetical protein [Vulcanisaeta sp. JCM 16161]|uniref:hypothetical protein n=1 Tax=Vulcanisaeta sp. JCM 16161 TaxID=1295372 RepID=UPI000AC6EA0A|nr:hypothetical protein [Vulcanisaeta sp. JCM 16161]